MATAPRPWWIGPAVGAGLFLAITNAPEPAAGITRDVLGGAGRFVEAVFPNSTTTDPGNPIPSPQQAAP